MRRHYRLRSLRDPLPQLLFLGSTVCNFNKKIESIGLVTYTAVFMIAHIPDGNEGVDFGVLRFRGNGVQAGHNRGDGPSETEGDGGFTK